MPIPRRKNWRTGDQHQNNNHLQPPFAPQYQGLEWQQDSNVGLGKERDHQQQGIYTAPHAEERNKLVVLEKNDKIEDELWAAMSATVGEQAVQFISRMQANQPLLRAPPLPPSQPQPQPQPQPQHHTPLPRVQTNFPNPRPPPPPSRPHPQPRHHTRLPWIQYSFPNPLRPPPPPPPPSLSQRGSSRQQLFRWDIAPSRSEELYHRRLHDGSSNVGAGVWYPGLGDNSRQ